MKSVSLRQRLLLSSLAVLIVFLGITFYALENAYKKSVWHSHYNSLEGYLSALIAASNIDERGRLTIDQASLGPNFSIPNSGLYAVIYKEDTNSNLWSSISTLGVELPELSDMDIGSKVFRRDVNIDGKSFFVLSFGIAWQIREDYHELVFAIMEDYTRFDEDVATFRKTMRFWLISLAFLLLGIQALVLHWGLNPLRKVASEIGEIEAGKKNKLEGKYPNELDRLTSNINALITNERQHLKRHRHTLSDLAHSLKTPIAVLRNYFYDQTSQSSSTGESSGMLGMPQQSPQKDDGASKKSKLSNADQKNLIIAQEQVERMHDIVDYQLQRAAVSGKKTFSAPIEVKPYVEKIANALGRAYFEKNLHCEIDISDGVQFYGDKGDFMEIVGNVCENAFKWSKTKVRISAHNAVGVKGKNSHKFIIQVDDDGKGFPQQLINDVIKRGVRGDMNEGPAGQGIGLSVVKDIVDSYQGELVLSDNEWQGASIRLVFETS